MKLFPSELTPSIGISDEMPDGWASVPDRFRRSDAALPAPWEDRFGPLRQGARDGLMVVAQIGQSVDGRVATNGGRGEFINGAAGLDHLHRLRALVDAVVVGVGTAVADNPQLTVRRVSGPHPVRVVIDPRGRMSSDARMLDDDGTRRIVVAGNDMECALPRGVEVLRVPLADGKAEPAAILAALAGCGLRRILIEGGSRTLSCFLAAGCLDRLHVMVAPMLLGSGQASLDLPHVKRAGDALRPPMRAHLLDDEVLFDVDLSAQRIAIGA
jgi:diaminohydroxyphosphoribosylaminopyrimidine deaminase/5-amino-6-(5-phosphoribosylamino)uracil reductase